MTFGDESFAHCVCLLISRVSTVSMTSALTTGINSPHCRSFLFPFLLRSLIPPWKRARNIVVIRRVCSLVLAVASYRGVVVVVVVVVDMELGGRT